MKKSFKDFSINHKTFFQIAAPITTIIATICYNLRKDQNNNPNDIPVGFGYLLSIQLVWFFLVLSAILSYVMFYIGQKNTSDENIELKKEIKAAEKTNIEISEKHLQLQTEYENLRINYNSFFDKILSLIYTNLNLGGRDRISVYFIPQDEEIFILQSRFSKNQNLNKKSNKNYPFKEGFIYKAIEESGLEENIENIPEENIDKYVNEVRKKCLISEDRIKNLNMQSRSYYIKNIDDENNATIGVIVLESLDINRFKNIRDNDSFSNYLTIIKHFISKHRSRFFSNLASTKGF